MAENINRGYEVVLKELFFGKDAALNKYAKVWRTYYEIVELYDACGLPLSEVDSASKAYFSQRFLKCQISKAPTDVMKKAVASLGYAAGLEDGNPVETGCRQRCHRLVNELNMALVEAGFPMVDEERFIKFFTFDYDVVLDENGKPRLEPGYSFEIRHFHSDENRLWFRMILKVLFILKLRMPMQCVYNVAKYFRKYAKPAPKPAKAKPTK